MDELQKQINELKERTKKLEESSNYSFSEGMKDRFFENSVIVADFDTSATTKVISLTGGPQNITVVDQSKLPKVAGTLTLVYKGTRYKLLYE